MSVIERDAAICLRCWTVVVCDGENNLDRAPQLCSHLGPAQEVVPAERLRGAVEARDALASALRTAAGQLELIGYTLSAANARATLDRFGGQ